MSEDIVNRILIIFIDEFKNDAKSKAMGKVFEIKK